MYSRFSKLYRKSIASHEKQLNTNLVDMGDKTIFLSVEIKNAINISLSVTHIKFKSITADILI